jgi:cell pole-organizing protein PopZ
MPKGTKGFVPGHPKFGGRKRIHPRKPVTQTIAIVQAPAAKRQRSLADMAAEMLAEQAWKNSPAGQAEAEAAQRVHKPGRAPAALPTPSTDELLRRHRNAVAWNARHPDRPVRVPSIETLQERNRNMPPSAGDRSAILYAQLVADAEREAIAEAMRKRGGGHDWSPLE